jgi:hypothetical protein
MKERYSTEFLNSLSVESCAAVVFEQEEDARRCAKSMYHRHFISVSGSGSGNGPGLVSSPYSNGIESLLLLPKSEQSLQLIEKHEAIEVVADYSSDQSQTKLTEKQPSDDNKQEEVGVEEDIDSFLSSFL